MYLENIYTTFLTELTTKCSQNPAWKSDILDFDVTLLLLLEDWCNADNEQGGCSF